MLFSKQYFQERFSTVNCGFCSATKPEAIKVIEATQWALKCTIISFNKACPGFFISLKPNKNSNVTTWIAETVNSFVAKVIWKTAICEIPYLLKHYQVHETFFIHNTFTERVFKNNHGLLLSWAKSQIKHYRYTGNVWDVQTQQSYKPLTILFSLKDCKITLGLVTTMRAAKSCCHDSELSLSNISSPKCITMVQCCMTVIYLEVDVVLLTSWIALKRLQSKFVSSKARSQVLIPKILTDLCCNSSFSENGF